MVSSNGQSWGLYPNPYAEFLSISASTQAPARFYRAVFLGDWRRPNESGPAKRRGNCAPSAYTGKSRRKIAS